MARKRMIDPNIWQSEDFSKLSNLSKIIFIGLFSLADDEGYGKANPTLIKNSIFPFDEKLRTTDIKQSLQEIATNMSIVFYTAEDGKDYYLLSNWSKWQSIQKPTESKIPELNDECTVILQDNYSSPTVGLQPNRKEENKNRIEKEYMVKNFEEFYAVYPRKVKKDAAFKSWEKINPNDKLKEVILSNLKKQIAFYGWDKLKSKDMQYVPHPSTWLNNKRWEDELEADCGQNLEDSGVVL